MKKQMLFAAFGLGLILQAGASWCEGTSAAQSAHSPILEQTAAGSQDPVPAAGPSGIVVKAQLSLSGMKIDASAPPPKRQTTSSTSEGIPQVLGEGPAVAPYTEKDGVDASGQARSGAERVVGGQAGRARSVVAPVRGGSPRATVPPSRPVPLDSAKRR